MKEIEQYFINTYALVMCGGNSSRMRADKSMLTYFDKPQRYHLYHMLQPFCEKIFIACNENQVNTIETRYEFIKDDAAFANTGPMGALLTAFIQYPAKNILLIGCDYPFLMKGELEHFSAFCKDTAAAFYSEEDAVYEPMLAWYPSTCFDKLKIMFAEKKFSLQHFLKDADAVKYLPVNFNSIKSIDTNQDFLEALKHIER